LKSLGCAGEGEHRYTLDPSARCRKRFADPVPLGFLRFPCWNPLTAYLLRLHCADLQSNHLRCVAGASLSQQVNKELDFSNEAVCMNSIRVNLQGIKNVTVPSALAGLVTPRMLIMDFVEGRNLNAIRKESQNLPEWKKRVFGLQLLSLMSQAWGHMIFSSGLMHGDPHPGNLLVSMKRRGGLGRFLPPALELGIIDMGQAKQLTGQAQTRLAELVIALSEEGSAHSDTLVASALRATGLRFARMGSEEDAFLARAARLVFSTENVDGKAFQPFGKDSVLAENGVSDIPADLVFVIRVIQIQRGIAAALNVNDFSLAERWRPAAKEYLLSRRSSSPC
jgi:predicted unusual protein kinase regulating ubiquinone biosynthesis (AarF/ABC1/UbiB family)